MQHFLFTATHVQLTMECRARIIEDCITPKSPFGVEVAWDLGAESRKEAFLLYYTLLKEIGRI